MNWARMHMKMWIEKKNEHKASVQRRRANRGKIFNIFKRWQETIGYVQDEQKEQDGRKGKVDEEGKKEKTYGIKYWGRVRYRRAYILPEDLRRCSFVRTCPRLRRSPQIGEGAMLTVEHRRFCRSWIKSDS
eukprot:6202525-Pleurochrysis_carterae.AAC.1